MNSKSMCMSPCMIRKIFVWYVRIVWGKRKKIWRFSCLIIYLLILQQKQENEEKTKIHLMLFCEWEWNFNPSTIQFSFSRRKGKLYERVIKWKTAESSSFTSPWNNWEWVGWFLYWKRNFTSIFFSFTNAVFEMH